MSSLDDTTLARAVCGGGNDGGKEVSSSTKTCTSCEQKNDHCNKVGVGGNTVDDIVDGINNTVISSDDELFQDPPPKEDCSICMLPMPFTNGIRGARTVYEPCCGKVLCGGCLVASKAEMDKGSMKKWCPYCRVPISASKKEIVVRIRSG